MVEKNSFIDAKGIERFLVFRAISVQVSGLAFF